MRETPVALGSFSSRRYPPGSWYFGPLGLQTIFQMGKHVGGGDSDLISARIQAVVQLAPLAHRFQIRSQRDFRVYSILSVLSECCNKTADGGRKE